MSACLCASKCACVCVSPYSAQCTVDIDYGACGTVKGEQPSDKRVDKVAISLFHTYVVLVSINKFNS